MGVRKEKLSLGRAPGCRRGWHGDRAPIPGRVPGDPDKWSRNRVPILLGARDEGQGPHSR